LFCLEKIDSLHRLFSGCGFCRRARKRAGVQLNAGRNARWRQKFGVADRVNKRATQTRETLQLNLLTESPRVALGAVVVHTVSVIFRAIRASSGLCPLVLAIAALTLGGGCDDESSAPDRDAAVPEVDSGLLDAAVPVDDSGVDAGSDAAVPLPDGDFVADYCQPLAQLLCERAATCGCGAVVPSGTLDVEGCEAQWLEQCKSAYTPIIGLVAAGEAHVLGDRARACVAHIAELTPECELPQAQLITFVLCEPFFASATPLGDSCQAVPLCALGEGACVEGQCVPRANSGDECGSEFECATGFACLDGQCDTFGTDGDECSAERRCEPPFHCVAGRCGTLRSAGEDCMVPGDCEQGLVCGEDGKCAMRASETCSAEDACGHLQECAAPRACAPRVGEGDACTSDRQCEPELFCGDDQRCTVRPALDEPCARGALCAAGLACEPPGAENPICRPLPAEGEPCATDENGPFVCGAGLGCSDQGSCQPLPTAGQPCAMINRCADGLACDFTAEGSLCVEPKPLGGACQNEVVCGAEAHCAAGACTADEADGTPCTVGNECLNVCVPADTGALVCAPPRAQGDACIFDDDCPLELACAPRAERVTCVPELCTAL
jgi:hypothetical protein